MGVSPCLGPQFGGASPHLGDQEFVLFRVPVRSPKGGHVLDHDIQGETRPLSVLARKDHEGGHHDVWLDITYCGRVVQVPEAPDQEGKLFTF
jgi:hypothetical protein